jgi:predicted metal-dependent hydrolase
MGLSMDINIIRSKRRTYAAEIRDCKVIVRAPLWADDAQIGRFVEKHRHWIEVHLQKAQERAAAQELEEKLSEAELRALAQQAATVIPERVRFYAQKIGVTYGRITIRSQKTRWGSCSAKGNLNFNCMLMLAPPEVVDSVVVHELCHRKEMNHSPRFYAEVLKAFPEYRKWNKWLKENGAAILRRR